MQAKALGHPLMDRNKCVRNGIDIDKRPFFIIITGANMAGKSTYLRTVWVRLSGRMKWKYTRHALSPVCVPTTH